MKFTEVFEARYYGDPADVAEVNELKAIAAEERRRKRAPMDLIHNRRRIQALVAKVLKKARTP